MLDLLFDQIHYNTSSRFKRMLKILIQMHQFKFDIDLDIMINNDKYVKYVDNCEKITQGSIKLTNQVEKDVVNSFLKLMRQVRFRYVQVRYYYFLDNIGKDVRDALKTMKSNLDRVKTHQLWDEGGVIILDSISHLKSIRHKIAELNNNFKLETDFEYDDTFSKLTNVDEINKSISQMNTNILKFRTIYNEKIITDDKIELCINDTQVLYVKFIYHHHITKFDELTIDMQEIKTIVINYHKDPKAHKDVDFELLFNRFKYTNDEYDDLRKIGNEIKLFEALVAVDQLYSRTYINCIQNFINMRDSVTKLVN